MLCLRVVQLYRISGRMFITDTYSDRGTLIMIYVSHDFLTPL